ncbi:MAG TPA: aminotransferase class I/II-fold pyridoxal phosphate-dependent enzyme [Anaerolineaceae bacterium]|nr:aminotransferase class I/II-fold pyridoxal phosphate-dependent enzyme [Anaerolineaceae bacterium]
MPDIQPFLLERYFARYEFSAPFLLSPSDCESLHLNEVLALADAECAALWENLSLGYTESSGHPLLREEISRLYASLRPEDVLVMAPEEGIYIAMQTLLRPGDEVIAIQPAYQSLQEIARSIGCAVIPWALQPADGAWRLDFDTLERSFSPRTRLLVINFPHNPTGLLPALAELDAILELARRRGVHVFSDEMYRLLEYQPDGQLPAVCDRYELGISLSGMSKALALPGLRIGWLATRAPGLLQSWQTFKDYTTICSSAPSEILALIGLRARRQILERSLAIIRANLETAGQFFARHAGRFTWFAPRAGSVAFPRWDGPGTSDELASQVLEKEGVMIVPGSLFSYPGRHFRVGLGRRNFPTALERVELFLEG